MDVAIGFCGFVDAPKDRREANFCVCQRRQTCRKNRTDAKRNDLRLRVLTYKGNLRYRRFAIARIAMPHLKSAIFKLLVHRGRRRGTLNTGVPSIA